MKKAVLFPYYPFLIAALPILRFYETNWKTTSPSDLGQAFFSYQLVAGIFLLLFRQVWRNWSSGALVAAPLLFVFGLGFVLGSWVALTLLLAFFLAGGLLFFFKPEIEKINPILNLTLAAFCLLSLTSGYRNSHPDDSPTPKQLFHSELELPPVTDESPDIYFILMDGLGQPEILAKNYGIPSYSCTLPFEHLGFQFAEASNACYIQTALSLASTFNAAPIQDLLEIPNFQSRDRRVLGDLFKNSRVVRALHRAGYRIETMSTGYPLTRVNLADENHKPFGSFNFVTYMILEDGFLPLLQPLLGFGKSEMSFAMRRKQIGYFLDHLPNIASRKHKQPVFTFAHVIAPHPPFVFNRLGKPRPSQRIFTYSDGSHWMGLQQPGDETYNHLFRDQASFLLQKLAETMATILEKSEKPPIIVIQGDHGPGGALQWNSPARSDLAERFGIFNAWYVPEEVRKSFRPDIASINTFPVIFNATLGVDWDLQKEEYWFTSWLAPYTFLPLIKH